MSTFIDEMIETEKELSKKLGKFNLFTLIESEDISNRWDLVVSIDKYEKDFVVKEIIEHLSHLTIDTQLKINTVVFLKPTVPFVMDFTKKFDNIKDEDREISNKTINDVFIKHAHVIFSGSTA
jgi:DICT domain-containing protein